MEQADRAPVLRDDVHQGKVALVTGGGTGLGRAIALDLARGGADVVVAGRRSEPLAQTVRDIEALGARALAIEVDIREEEQVTGMVTRSLAVFGRVDILVNNAGGQFAAPAKDISVKGWRAVHRLAVEGSWSVTSAVANRAMIPQRAGVIFFMGFSPRRGIASVVHAASARAALENLASGLSMEWSRYGIRTMCIAPGTIETPGMVENYTEEARASWASAVPMGRLGVAEDVSQVVSFLSTSAASYITGATITVDGGVDAWGAGTPAPPLEAAVRESDFATTAQI